MKKHVFLFAAILATLLFHSCEEDPESGRNGTGTTFIINYGSYVDLPSTVSVYDRTTDSIAHNIYKTANGVSLTSNVQYAYESKNDIFLVGNVTDQLIRLDKTSMEQTMNGVKDGIANPRFCVADDEKLYISCWGAVPDWNLMPDSYIAVYDLENDSVEKKIALPGGPEGLEIANGKLFAAMNFIDSIAVIDISTHHLSYIVAPTVSSYMKKDLSDNIFIAFVGRYSDMGPKSGLGYINTSSNVLEEVYPQENISQSYVSVLDANADFSKIYVMTSTYDADWNLSGAVAVFDVATKSYENGFLVENISGLNGLAVDPVTDNVFCFVSESVVNTGRMYIYNSQGEKQSEHTTGAAPFMALFVD